MPFYTKRMVKYLEGKDGKKKKKGGKEKHEKGLRVAPTGAGTSTIGVVAQTDVQTTQPTEHIPDQTFDQKLLYMKG